MRLTPTQRKVLTQAVADGGIVELSGLDMHNGWTKRERTAAKVLQTMGLGEHNGYYAHQEPSWFKINAEGRKALDTM